MRTLGWTRSIILYATPLLASFATIGCGEEPPVESPTFSVDATGELGLPPPDGGIPQCELYKEDPDVYGYCIYKFAGGFPNVDEVERLCPMAGDWEKECRHAWVSGRMNSNSGMDMDYLLKICDGNPDCTFELIDFRPNPDVLIQMDYCIKHVGPYIRDCLGHAMQRWWYTAPSEEEVTRVATAKSPYPDRIAFYVAASVACSGIGSCDGDHAMKNICLKNVENYKKFPNRCPAQEEKPMKGSLKSEDLKTKTGMSKPQQPVQKKGPPLHGQPSGQKPSFQKPLHQPRKQ